MRLRFGKVGRLCVINPAFSLLAASPEASFWISLCHLREGQIDKALEGLQALCVPRVGSPEHGIVHEDGSIPVRSRPPTAAFAPFIDPPLYLGTLLLRRGPTKEALRLLTEANRIDSSCPIVTVLLGSAMIAAGGDAALATRALKKALGRSGLGRWTGNPGRAWVEAFPERRSYVRKLAEKHPFICPLWGGDLTLLTRQGNLALAQGLFRLGQFREASDLFNEVLKEGAPSAAVLRGLGISLARLGKYDEAFKHLRIAHEMEEPKDRLTTGYLALCGALGTPSKPEDKIQNVAWAVRLVTQFNAPGDNEWIALISELFAEARGQQIPLTLDDQLYLCEHLASIEAVDAHAAQAYEHLQATFPQAVRAEYAWLFCRAVAQTEGDKGGKEEGEKGRKGEGEKGEGEKGEGQASVIVSGNAAINSPSPLLPFSLSPLPLFALTFNQKTEAHAFFDEHHWDFDAVELRYLTAAAELAPGSFPASLGPDYPAHGEALLLARSFDQEKAGQLPAARATMEILDRLSPHNPRALDRLAYLHYRLEQSDQALAVLGRWQEARPLDPIPLLRQAVFLYQGQRSQEGQARIRQALECSQGKQRADAAFLGARLALFHGREELATAQDLLQECVQSWPEHVQALACLAAVRWLRGDLALLAAQRGAMESVKSADPRFSYLAALCAWAAHDAATTVQRLNHRSEADKETASESNVSLSSASAKPQAVEPAGLNLDLESSFLKGLAYCRLEDWPNAQTALEPVGLSADSPSAPLAQAYLGSVCFAQEKYIEAESWWQTLDAKKRAGWQLAEPLAGAAFLSALAAMEAGRFEEAAERFRTAGKLGCRDRRLGPLLIAALFRAGQKSYYAATP